MIRNTFVVAMAFLLVACNSSAPVAESEPVTNTASQSDKVRETVASHDAPRTPTPTPEANTAPALAPKASKERRKFSRSGEAIDTKKFDDAIAAAKKAYEAKTSDEALKKELGSKYFERGVALTAARQYASAIGDFRKTLKYDPSNSDAQQQIKVISSIYDSMNIEGPKPGEEPEPIRKGEKKEEKKS